MVFKRIMSSMLVGFITFSSVAVADYDDNDEGSTLATAKLISNSSQKYDAQRYLYRGDVDIYKLNLEQLNNLSTLQVTNNELGIRVSVLSSKGTVLISRSRNSRGLCC